MPNRYEVAYGLLILIWVVSGVFITMANVKLGSYKKKDNYLHNAYWNTFACAFVTWTLLGIIILIMILALVGIVALFATGVGEAEVVVAGTGELIAEETATDILATQAEKMAKDKAISTITKNKTTLTKPMIFLLGFSLFLVIVSGILAAVSASQIAKSPNYNKTDTTLNAAYRECIIGAVLSLGSAGILLIIIIVAMISYEKEQTKVKELAEQLEAQKKQHELEMQQLKEKHDRELLRARAQKIKDQRKKQEDFQNRIEQAKEQKILQDISQGHLSPIPTSTQLSNS